VLGQDLIGLLWGLIIVAVGVPVVIWSYRRYLPYRVLTKESGSIFRGNKVREWVVFDPTKENDEGSVWFSRILHGLGLLIILAAGSCSISGGIK